MKIKSILLISVALISIAFHNGKINNVIVNNNMPWEEGDYRVIKINTQIWMAENLNVDSFKNGEKILQSNSRSDWVSANLEQMPTWCYYNFDTAYKNRGRIYNWYAVNDRRGLAPVGWHVATKNDFETLINYSKNKYSLQSDSCWEIDQYDSEKCKQNWRKGTNETGFSALPGGWFTSSCTPYFRELNSRSEWWSSTRVYDTYGFAHTFYISNCSWGIGGLKYDNGGYVRCIKDALDE